MYTRPCNFKGGIHFLLQNINFFHEHPESVLSTNKNKTNMLYVVKIAVYCTSVYCFVDDTDTLNQNVAILEEMEFNDTVTIILNFISIC